MRRIFCISTTLFLLTALSACESGTQTTTPTSSPPSASPQVSALPATPVAVANEPATPVSNSLTPNYAGTYAVRDTAICPLSIIITRRGAGYSFSCINGQTVQGKMEVSREASGTYFTFIGLKGEEPEENISAVWQDSVLVIQNSGNSMNEYTRFGNCDAKYLELHRQ